MTGKVTRTILLLALTGCGGGSLVAPESADFARGGAKLQVFADVVKGSETQDSVRVSVSWTGTASLYDVEIRGPEDTASFDSVPSSPVSEVMGKYVFGNNDQYTSDYIAQGCVKPVGSSKFQCDDVLIPGVWTSPPPPPPDPPLQTVGFARPVADSLTGSWTSSSGALWDRLEEGQPHDSDASFIRSTNDPDSSGSWVVKLGSVADPGVDSLHVFHAYHKKTNSSGRDYNMHYELWEGPPGSMDGTLIREFIDHDLTNSYRSGSFHFPLSSDVEGKITNYDNLYVRGFAVSVGGGKRGAIEVTLIELEVREPVPEP